MKKSCRKLIAFLAIVLGCLMQANAQNYAEFTPDLTADYTIKNANDGKFLTYKGLNGNTLFEDASDDMFNHAFKFVKVEADGNTNTDEYYIVSVSVKTEGVAVTDLEHLNESGVSKVENAPGWHVVRVFKNTDNNTFAMKLVGSDANSSKNKRNTLFINGNKLGYRNNDANYNLNPPTSDYVFVLETVVIDYTPRVDEVKINGLRAVAYGATTQYSAEIIGKNQPSQAVTWVLNGAQKTATTLSSTGLLTVAADESAAALTIKATSDYDDTKSAVISVTLINPPTTSAPTPVHHPDDVVGIFSNHYACGSFNVDYSDWLAADATLPHKEIITPFASDPDDHILFLDTILNGNVAQIALGAVNFLNKDSIHIDIYSPGSNDGIGEFDFSFYMGNADWSGSPGWIQADVWYAITSQNKHGQWIGIDVPVKKFTDKGPRALVLRLRRGSKGSVGKKLYVDNIYAYASKHIDHTPKITSVAISGSTATLRGSTVQYKSTVSGTDNPPTTVTWKLAGMNSDATTISDAGLLTVAIDESASKLTVTATSDYDETKFANVSVTLIDPPVMTVGESVDLTSVLPHCSAPLPRHDPDSVVGIFSNVYSYSANKFNLEYDDWLGAGKTACVKEIIYPFENEPVESLLKLDPLYSDNQAQIALGTCNIAEMDSIHIDIYSPGGDEGIGEFDFGLIFAWSGGNHVSANIWLNITDANLHGRWISFDLPLSQFIAYNEKFDVSNINILRLRRGGKGSKGAKLYVDNVYAYTSGGGGVQPPAPPKPGELEAPTTVPSVTIDEANVKSIFCEQFEAADYQENLGLWDVAGSATLDDPYINGKMNYGQNANQDREFVEIVPGNKSIKLTGWNDYPFKIHKTSTTMDMSDMEYLHVSAYLASSLIENKGASMAFYMHDNDSKKVDNPSDVAFVDMTPGEWVSISIPLCYYKDKVDLSNVYVLRPRLGGYSSMNVYIDNIFAYKGAPIGVVAQDCGEVPGPCTAIQDNSNGELPPRDRAFLGVNLSSASGGTNPGVLGTNYRYPKMEDLYYFNAKGVKLIRLPFRWKRVQSELGGRLNEQDIAEMKKVIKEAERLGMWVMPDMHDYCEYSVNDTLYEVGVAGYKLWRPAINGWGSWRESDEIRVTKEHYADVWVKLAEAFSDCSNIWGYDLMNEPKGININTLKDNYQAVINAIRKKDTKAAIVIEGKSYASSSSWPSVSDELKDLTDPANNLIYQAHTYFDWDASGTYTASYDNTVRHSEIYKDRFDPFVNWCKVNNKKGMIGEFGVPYNGASYSDERYMTMIDNIFAYLKEKQMSATYWCAGAFYETNHITVQPDKDYCTEKSTMKVMEKYIKDFHTGETSIENVNTENKGVFAYPNPVVDKLTICAGEKINAVQVYNLFGQLVFEQKLNGENNQLTLDFTPFANGSYIVQIQLIDGKTSVQKVIK